jgi:hypothetical protein
MFFKRVFEEIVGEKSLKFVVISTGPSSNCDQTLQSFNAALAAGDYRRYINRGFSRGFS